MEKLIVGCGYLGRRVARRWIDQDHRVWALTRSEANAEEMTRMGINPVIGDICDVGSLNSLPAVHTVLFAVGYDRNSGKTQREVYVDGLANTLSRVGQSCEQFIYVSSSSVYGQSAGEWVDEASPCEPVQPGGICCLAAESAVRKFFSSGNASRRANILRLSGIYGPGRLLARAESLRLGEPISGRGDAWLNLIHVDDATSAVVACEQRGFSGETYLISDNQPVTREEYYLRLAELVGAPPPRFLDNEPAKRGSGGLNKRCRNQKAREQLGLVLMYPSITEGLSHALEQQSESASS